MLLMIKKCIRDGRGHGIQRYEENNEKYMRDHDKDKYPSYLMYQDLNNLCEWGMSKKLIS